MKLTASIALIFLLLSCQSEPTFDELINTPIKSMVHSYLSDELKFKVGLPHNWDIVRSDQEKGWLAESFSDTISKQQVKPFLTVLKYKGETNDLNKEYTLQRKNLTPQFIIKESGKSNFLTQPSYFMFGNTAKQSEEGSGIVGFLVQGREDSTFYSITGAVPKGKDYELEMANLLKCVKGFELN